MREEKEQPEAVVVERFRVLWEALGSYRRFGPGASSGSSSICLVV